MGIITICVRYLQCVLFKVAIALCVHMCLWVCVHVSVSVAVMKKLFKRKGWEKDEYRELLCKLASKVIPIKIKYIGTENRHIMEHIRAYRNWFRTMRTLYKNKGGISVQIGKYEILHFNVMDNARFLRSYTKIHFQWIRVREAYISKYIKNRLHFYIHLYNILDGANFSKLGNSIYREEIRFLPIYKI